MMIAEGKTARALYEDLIMDRQAFIDRAEKAASLTIPMAFPPIDLAQGHQQLPTPRQGLGAKGCNHFQSRLMLTLLPATDAFFRYDMDKSIKQVVADENDQAELEKFLIERVRSVQMQIMQSGARLPISEAVLQLIIAGNALTYYDKSRKVHHYPLSRYVVKRDSAGLEWVLIVVRELVHPMTMDDDLREVAIAAQSESEPSSEPQPVDEDIEIFTRIWRDGKNVRWHQEFGNGEMIAGSEGVAPVEVSPWQPHAWKLTTGEDYSRSMVDEIIGDLEALEELSGASIEMALAAARVVGMVRPNGLTHIKDLNDAKNGEFIVGQADDVSFPQLGKLADSRMVQWQIESIEKRLQESFLMNQSVTRNAERVTAEEIRLLAREIETAYAGVYLSLADSIQLPLVKFFEWSMQKDGTLERIQPEFRDALKPVIITGVEAIGRAAELDRVQIGFGLLGQILGPQMLASLIKPTNLITYVMTQAGVQVEGLTKSEEELQQEQQAAQKAQAAQAAVERGIGPAINAAAQGGAPSA